MRESWIGLNLSNNKDQGIPVDRLHWWSVVWEWSVYWRQQRQRVLVSVQSPSDLSRCLRDQRSTEKWENNLTIRLEELLIESTLVIASNYHFIRMFLLTYKWIFNWCSVRGSTVPSHVLNALTSFGRPQVVKSPEITRISPANFKFTTKDSQIPLSFSG